MAQPALAASATATHTEQPSGHKSQMPQLDPETYVPQLFWLFVTFVVLYVLMKRLALPQVSRAIDARRDRLEGDLARAAALKTQAETVLADYEKALATARSEAQSTLRQTNERLAAEAAERQRELTTSLNAQIEAAEQRIVTMKDQALAEVRGIATDVGRAVVERLTGAAPATGRLEAAVDGALARRGG